MEMTREAFARALYQGLGRTIVYARAHDVSSFAGLILEACLRNPIYDRQTGVDRAPYLAELIEVSSVASYLRSHILAALADPDEEMDEKLLLDLTRCFAEAGDNAARRALVARFLHNVSAGEIAGYNQLIALDGDDGLRVAVEQIGVALQREVDFDNTWLLGRLLDDLDEAFADDPSVLNDPRVLTCRAAARLAPVEQAAQKQRQALRDSLPTLTYQAIWGAVTRNELSLMSMRCWAEQASETELRARAEALLAHADTLELGVILLVGNHEPGDYALLTALARQHAGNDEALHAIVWRTHELFSQAPSPSAAGLLLELYERGPCTQWRERVAEHLLALNALPAELAEEYRFDASEKVRALVGGTVG